MVHHWVITPLHKLCHLSCYKIKCGGRMIKSIQVTSMQHQQQLSQQPHKYEGEPGQYPCRRSSYTSWWGSKGMVMVREQHCPQCPSHNISDITQSQKKMYRSGSSDTFSYHKNTLTSILESSFKWYFCMQQENITTNTGKYSPLKILSYPVNPHHRESRRSCPVNTGGLPP